MKKSEIHKYASKYAKALFELALEEKKIEKIMNDIAVLEATLQKNPKLIKTLSSHVLSNKKRADVMADICAKAKFQPYTAMCLQIMSENKGISYIPSFIDILKTKYQESKNIYKVSINSAKPLTAKHKKEISASFKKAVGFNADIYEEVDESLVGGLVVTFKSQRIDDSIKTKLERLNTMMKGTA